jgi:glycosyltransferase involved in cell wall biosynthesis
MLEKKLKLLNIKVIWTPMFMETGAWDLSAYDEYLRGKEYLLYFGRLQLHKGFHVLAEALPQVLEKCQALYAVCIGRDSSTRIAQSMGTYAQMLCGKNKDRLILFDQIPHAMLYPIITKAKLVILPSLVDNLPNACLEAMLLGKPVLGTVGTSFDEVIEDGFSGFLVSPGDSEALANKIIEACHCNHLQSIGNAAKEQMKRFAPKRTVTELLRYYEDVIEEERASRFQFRKLAK